MCRSSLNLAWCMSSSSCQGNIHPQVFLNVERRWKGHTSYIWSSNVIDSLNSLTLVLFLGFLPTKGDHGSHAGHG